MLFVAILAMLFGCNDITRLGDSEASAIRDQTVVLERLVQETDTLNKTLERVLDQMAFDNSQRK